MDISAIKPGNIVWKVDEDPVDWSPENRYRLNRYEITKVGKIHLLYVQLDLPRRPEPRRATIKDFFREGIYFGPEECISAFNKILLQRIFEAENAAIRRREEYFKYRETLGRTLPDR